MNPIFKHNIHKKYSTKDLKGRHNTSNYSLLDVYLNEKGPSVKIQLLNVFKNNHIVGQLSPRAVGFDEWPLSNALWMKFYNSHGKYKAELKEYFHMF